MLIPQWSSLVISVWVETDCPVGSSAPPQSGESAEKEVWGRWGRGTVVGLDWGKQTGRVVSMNRLRCYPCGNGPRWYCGWPLRFSSRTSAGCSSFFPLNLSPHALCSRIRNDQWGSAVLQESQYTIKMQEYSALFCCLLYIQLTPFSFYRMHGIKTLTEIWLQCLD